MIKYLVILMILAGSVLGAPADNSFHVIPRLAFASTLLEWQPVIGMKIVKEYVSPITDRVNGMTVNASPEVNNYLSGGEILLSLRAVAPLDYIGQDARLYIGTGGPMGIFDYSFGISFLLMHSDIKDDPLIFPYFSVSLR